MGSSIGHGEKRAQRLHPGLQGSPSQRVSSARAAPTPSARIAQTAIAPPLHGISKPIGVNTAASLTLIVNRDTYAFAAILLDNVCLPPVRPMRIAKPRTSVGRPTSTKAGTVRGAWGSLAKPLETSAARLAPTERCIALFSSAILIEAASCFSNGHGLVARRLRTSANAARPDCDAARLQEGAGELHWGRPSEPTLVHPPRERFTAPAAFFPEDFFFGAAALARGAMSEAS